MGGYEDAIGWLLGIVCIAYAITVDWRARAAPGYRPRRSPVLGVNDPG